MKYGKKLVLFLLLFALLLPLCGCSAKPEQVSAEFKSLDELAGKRIGVQAGTTADIIAENQLDSPQLEYFNGVVDSPLALDAGKIDAYLMDEPIARSLFSEYPTHRILATLEEQEYGFVFPKTESGSALRDQFNEFLETIKADGTLGEIDSIWFGNDESKKVVDTSSLTGENGTLSFVTESGTPPFVYMQEGELIGYEIDIAVRFCKEYGYALNMTDIAFSGLLASVSSGKSDFGATCISITEERKESLYFSEPDYIGGVALVVKSGEAASAAADEYKSLDDLKGKRIGVLTGSVHDTVVPNHIADPKIVYVNAMTDTCVALENGKIDAFATEEPTAQMMLKEYPDQHILAQITNEDYAYIIGQTEKRDALHAQLNEFLAHIREDGTMDELKDIWLGADKEKQIIDFSGLTGENGTLHFATSTSAIGMPFSYIGNGQFCGYDIDIAVRFCREYGYDIDVQDMEFPGLLAAISSGKADFAACCITVTEERRESGILFSDPNYTGGIVIVTKGSTSDAFSSLDSLAGKRIAVLTGSVYDVAVSESIKDPVFSYVNSIADAGTALEKGKADAYAADEPVARLMLNEYPNHRILAQITNEDYAYIIGQTEKRDALHAQLNEFLAHIREDGTMDELKDIWLGADKEKQIIDFSGLTGENGTLHFATSTSAIGMPFSYIGNGQFCGYDIDIAVRFCREYGYDIDVQDMDFPGVLAAISSGKADFAACCITVTEGRRVSGILFSDPNYTGGIVIVVKDGEAKADGTFGGILDSFEKTFIREGRWKLFVSGIGVTVLITVLAVIFGTAIGFLLFLVYRKHFRVFNGFLNVLIDILEKTPVVVILMILYYIIFGRSDLSGIWVSVVGFSVMFACTFVGVVNVGVMAVDKGQTEASLALGFKDTHGFLRIILPQAAKHFMPNYRGSIVSLLKDTAIVGYIAVQDLTKVGDIVRSRTYEAFFPLIATAVIYFLLAWLLTLLVRRIEFKNDPTHRSREKILKGVKTK